MKKIFKAVFSFLAIAVVVMSCGFSAFGAIDSQFDTNTQQFLQIVSDSSLFRNNIYATYKYQLSYRYDSSTYDTSGVVVYCFKSKPILTYNASSDIYILYDGGCCVKMNCSNKSTSLSGDYEAVKNTSLIFKLDSNKISRVALVDGSDKVAYDKNTFPNSIMQWEAMQNIQFHCNFIPMGLDSVIENNPNATIKKSTFIGTMSDGTMDNIDISDNISVSVAPKLNNDMSNPFSSFRVTVDSLTDCYVIVEIHDSEASLCTSTANYYEYYWGSGNYNQNSSHRIYRHNALLDEKTWDKDNPLSEGEKSNTYKYDPFIACPANQITYYDIPLKYIQLSKDKQYYFQVWAVTKKESDNGGANNAYSVFHKYFTLKFNPPTYQAPPWGNGEHIDNNMRDNSGNIIQSSEDGFDLKANTKSFQTLVTQSKGFLGFVKYSMDCILPSWVWLIFGLMITAMVVMRVLGR